MPMQPEPDADSLRRSDPEFGNPVPGSLLQLDLMLQGGDIGDIDNNGARRWSQP